MRAAANDQNAFRRTIGAEIDRLIALLDSIDGDCDLEDGNDTEPSLGWPVHGLGSLGNGSGTDDREADDCDDEDGADDEPSLGWNLQGEMGPTFDPDREYDDSDTEPNGDDKDYNGDEGDVSAGRFDGGSGL